MSVGAAGTCDYCGLPVPLPLWRSAPVAAAPQFCCYGCRFAAAVTHSKGPEGAVTGLLARLGLAIFLTMNVMVFSMALWSEDFYGADSIAAPAWIGSLRGVFRYLSLIFSLPVLLILGGPLLEEAWHAVRRGRMTTDLLLVIGIAASYVYSAIAVVRDMDPVYFEVGCMVLVLVTLGRWLEAHGKLRTTAAIESLDALLPKQARVLHDGHEERVPLHVVTPGDAVLVLPGERIPCDGVIVRDRASIDEQVLTGESQPVSKSLGDLVWGGTLALDGGIVLEAGSRPSEGALARLIEHVREATLAKGHFERLADRITSWFLPTVVLIAFGAFLWHATYHGIDRGILVGLAVLLIACPCALGLATPMAVWAALGHAARSQVLFRSGEALERLATIRAVRFDKTGTLTTGAPAVASFVAGIHEDGEIVLSRALALANVSNHTYGRAIAEFAEAGSPNRSTVAGIQYVPGCGMHAHHVEDGATLYLGNPGWLQQKYLACPRELAEAIEQARNEGQALCCVGWGERIRGVFALHEQIRPEARTALLQLQGMGLDLAVLTGDHATRGQALAAELGVPVQAELMPEDKVAAVERARHEIGPVAMVGDGINDAPALARSDVGIALGCGADVTRDAASVCLLGNDLTHLAWAMALARQTVRVIRGNLFWAFAYNVIGIGIACSGRLNPVVASLAMVLSSGFVVANSVRLAGASHSQDVSPLAPLSLVEAQEAVP